MKIGILGSGAVGTTIGKKLVSLGHEVKIGSRKAGNDKGQAFVREAGARASEGSFADAAAFGELLFNCTRGEASLEALAQAGEAAIGDKILIDVANPLDFSKGMPPSLLVANTDSLGEQIQRRLPRAKVVKTLNTVTAAIMVDPKSLAGGAHDLFVCGNDAAAKGRVAELLGSFGWSAPIDLGDVSAARATEAYLLLWVRLYGTYQTPLINLKIVR